MTQREMSGATIFVQPDIRRKRITVELGDGDHAGARVRIKGTPHECVISDETAQIDFPDFEPWTPETPTLYTLQYEPAGDASSAHATRFGMRECSAKESGFTLNQRPVYVHGYATAGDGWLRGKATGDLPSCMNSISSAGFNAMWLPVSPEVDSLLELGDETGMMIFLEIGADCGDDELANLVEQVRNHPSLIAWVVTSGLAERCDVIRESDPSRLVLFDADQNNAEMSAPFLIRPYRSAREPYDPTYLTNPGPMDRYAELYLEHQGVPGVLTLVVPCTSASRAESAAASPRGGPETVLQEEAARAFGGEAAFIEGVQAFRARRLRARLDAVRLNPKIGGYFVRVSPDSWALTEGEAPLGEAVRSMLEQAQAPVRPVTRMARRNLSPRQEVPVNVTFLSDRRIEGRADLSLQVVGPTNQVLWKKKRGAKIPKPGRELWSGEVSASGSTGQHRFVVRLMREMKRLGESSTEFDVFDPVEPWRGDVHVLASGGPMVESCMSLVDRNHYEAPILVIPPVANTVRAYPNNDLMQMLGQIKEGAVALFFEPPDDWNDLAEIVDPELSATSLSTLGEDAEAIHYAKLHPLFDALPAGGVMGDCYRGVLPLKTFTDRGEEDISGCFLTPGDPDSATVRGNHVLVRRYGNGRIVFTHFRILERVGRDLVADRLFVNLLKHFGRRSVHAGGALPIHQKSVEWLHRERIEGLRRWMVIGMFPNWDGSGHDTAYPPEEEANFDMTYPGWYRAVGWRPWYTFLSDGHVVNLEDATQQPRFAPEGLSTGTAYAYTEFSSEIRGDGRLSLSADGLVRVWLNGRAVFSRDEASSCSAEPAMIEAHFKEGRNAVLVKISAQRGPLRLDLTALGVDNSAEVRWWS